MHYNVQIFTWTARLGVHQVGSVIEIDAPNPKAAAISLLGLRLDETGESSSWPSGCGEERTPREPTATVSTIIEPVIAGALAAQPGLCSGQFLLCVGLTDEGLSRSQKKSLISRAGLIFPDQHPPEPPSLRALARHRCSRHSLSNTRCSVSRSSGSKAMPPNACSERTPHPP